MFFYFVLRYVLLVTSDIHLFCYMRQTNFCKTFLEGILQPFLLWCSNETQAEDWKISPCPGFGVILFVPAIKSLESESPLNI